MDALNMDDLTWNMKCSMLNEKSSIVHDPALLLPGGGRPGGGRRKGNGQSYNRYSYCLNNPLKYVDPSGYKRKPFYEWEANATYYLGGGGFTGRIGPGSGNHWSDQNGHPMSAIGSYTYDWKTGKYFNKYGKEVSYNEVYVNYILPNGTTFRLSDFQNNPPSNQTQIDISKKSPVMFEAVNQNQLTSELLCMIYHKSFRDNYDDFISQRIVYMGLENINDIAAWIFEISELFPDELLSQEFYELNGITAIINHLTIESPIDNRIHNFGNPLQYEGILTHLSERYPFFSYRIYSTLNTTLHYDNIPLIINGNRYTFFMQWRLNPYYTYKP